MMFGGIFIIAGILHLYFNWKPFKKYLARRVAGKLNISRELLSSLVLTIVILFLSIYDLPPASWVFDLNDRIKASWVTSPELEPPFGHAEEVSLKGIARRMRLDLAAAIEELQARDIRFEPEQSLSTIARNNETTPMVIYSYISRHKQATTAVKRQSWTAEGIEAEFAGTGLGRKTIAELCDVAGVALDVCMATLNNRGVDASADARVREVSSAYELTPLDLLKMLLLPRE